MRLARRTLIILSVGYLLYCPMAIAQLALFTISELSQKSKLIFVANVDSTVRHNWKDTEGREIIVANATIKNSVKGVKAGSIAIAFRPLLAEEPKFLTGESYLIFSFSNSSNLLLAHQIVALPIAGDLVTTEGIKNEPTQQSIAELLIRVRQKAN